MSGRCATMGGHADHADHRARERGQGRAGDGRGAPPSGARRGAAADRPDACRRRALPARAGRRRRRDGCSGGALRGLDRRGGAPCGDRRGGAGCNGARARARGDSRARGRAGGDLDNRVRARAGGHPRRAAGSARVAGAAEPGAVELGCRGRRRRSRGRTGAAVRRLLRHAAATRARGRGAARGARPGRSARAPRPVGPYAGAVLRVRRPDDAAAGCDRDARQARRGRGHGVVGLRAGADGLRRAGGELPRPRSPVGRAQAPAGASRALRAAGARRVEPHRALAVRVRSRAGRAGGAG